MALKPMIIEKGIIQPSFGKSERIFRTSFFSAGVLDDKGCPIRQSRTVIMEQDVLSPSRINLSKTAIKYIDDDAIYFGRPQNHFGHTLVGTMAVAYILLNSDYKNHKIVFIDEEPSEPTLTLLGYLGVNRNNVITIKEYIQLKSVVVVKQSFSATWMPRNGKGPYRISEEFIDTFRAIAKKFYKEDGDYPDKVYFSRSKLHPFLTLMNENKIERVFEQNGYKIFYPEQLPLEEQIKLVANANFYACIAGTLEHHSLFMKDGATLIVMTRGKKPVYRQVYINKMQKAIKHIYLRTNVQPLGEKGFRGILGATKDLIDFFDNNKFVYDAQELKPKFQDLINYIEWHFSNEQKRTEKNLKKIFKKLITHNKNFWKQING
ncbi:MAG: glycosyltransferase family 61 protein [Chitinivibrionia bacterium]|nr:glycosyltransferase family 61 protein [Chitinivibrionia bacterium]